MQNRKTPIHLAVLGTGWQWSVACLLAPAAWAQTAATPAPAAADAAAPTQAIVVTARRVRERLLDAPLSVSAYTSSMLEESGVRDIVDLARLTPGFAMQDASRTNDTPFIRGMSINSAFRDQQHASSFIDGVFVQGLSRTLDFATEVERVEVIRGPQSALFGRATFSGAINYVTKAPSKTLEGRVVATVGQYGRQDLSASVSGPVTDMLQYRVSVQGHQYDGQWKNAGDGLPLGSEKTEGRALMLRLAPTTDLEVVLRSSQAQFHDGHPPTVLVGSSANNCNLGGTRPFLCGDVPIPSQVALNLSQVDGGYRRTEQNRNYVKVNWTIGDFELASTTSSNREQFRYYVDGDGTPITTAGGIYQGLFVEDFTDKSQDLRISSQAWGGKLRYQMGLYWFDGNYGIGQEKPTVSLASPINSVNKSVYGSLAYSFGSGFTVTFDARQQSDQITVRNAAGVVTNAQKTTNLLPRLIADWKPTADQTYYASVSKGSKPATFNTVAGTPPDRVNVAEQELKSYEVGARMQFFNGRATLAAAAYHIDWANQTTQQQITSTAGRLIFINANVGKTKIDGLEFEGSVVPIPNWELRAALGFNDARYVDFLSDVCFNVTGNRQCGGQKLQNTPSRQGSLSISNRQPLDNGWRWISRADVVYRNRMPMSEVNTATNPPMTLVNLRTGIETERWNVTAWVNNVGNDKSPAFATRFSDLNNLPQYGYQLTLRRQREAGVTASYQF